ncbi:MAG: DUF1285 domain-containing protein [Pseudomonadales bacterium]
MSKTFDVRSLIENAQGDARPPLHLWQPELCGDIDIFIDRRGQWFHEGEPFVRDQIPKMFARILVREGEQYFLKTPVEKWRIKVEDVPFQVVALQEEEGGAAQLTFVTSVEDVVVLDAEHPLRVEIDSQTQEPSPYITVRDGLEAKLSRSVFYQLAELAELDEAGAELYIESCGERFVLGAV